MLIASGSGACSGKLKGPSSRHEGGPGVVLKGLEIVGCNTAAIVAQIYASQKIDMDDFSTQKESSLGKNELISQDCKPYQDLYKW